MSKTESVPGGAESPAQHDDVDALVERAEAEATAAEAAAAEARARADRLQQQVPDGDPAAVESGVRWGRLATAGTVLCVCALIAASGWMLSVQRTAKAQERNRAEFVAAARQAVVTLMSIDFNDPAGSVQRIADNSTGPFRDEFLGAADDFSRVAKDAKVTTKATATAAAVESMTADSAVVLVSASSTVTDAAGADEPPRRWRLTVDLRREGDQIKMSKVEFVP